MSSTNTSLYCFGCIRNKKSCLSREREKTPFNIVVFYATSQCAQLMEVGRHGRILPDVLRPAAQDWSFDFVRATHHHHLAAVLHVKELLDCSENV